MCGSVFSPQFRDAYADHFTLEEGWRVKSGTGEYDGRIVSVIRRNSLQRLAASWGTEADAARLADVAPPPVEEERPIGENSRALVPFDTAAQYVASVERVPGYDVGGYITQMSNVSDETRALLREKFLDASLVEARTA